MEKDPRIVRSSLMKKGFVEVPDRKHIFYIFVYNGEETIFQTHMSHNQQPIYDYLISMMANQLGLSRKQFLGLVDCDLSEDDYISIVINK